METKDLRPCDCCGGPLRLPGIANFYVVRTSIAIWNANALNEQIGLAQMFGGGGPGLALAGIMGAQPEVAIVAMDKDKSLTTEILLCFNCWTNKLCLGELEAKANKD